MKILKLKIIKYCVFILPFLIVSCEKDFVDTSSLPQQGSSPQQVITPQEGQNKMLDVATGEADVTSAKLHENVKVLDETANGQMISYSDAKIEFISHESVNNIQAGDVLNSAPSTLAEYGILAKVLSKEVKDGKIILQVEPGEMEDLFAEADFSFNTQNGLTHSKSGKKSFSFEIDYKGAVSWGGSVSSNKASVKIAGRLDFIFDFQLREFWDNSDNYLRTKVNIHLNKDINDPDLALTLSKSVKAFIVKDRELGTVSVIVGGAIIPFTINADAGVEMKFDISTPLSPIGLDLHGTIGFDRTTIGGHFVDQTPTDTWNTIGYTTLLDRDARELSNFSAYMVAPKIEVRVTPFKRVSDIFLGEKITPLSIYAGVKLSGKLGFNTHTSCLTYSDPVLGLEGGIKGKFKDLKYELAISKKFPLGQGSLDWHCFDDNSGFALIGELPTFDDIKGNTIAEAEPSFTIENSSGLHMAEGLNGKKVVIKSMKGRNSNTEDHGLLYSTLPGDKAGEYLTIESAPDGNYYNSNYKVLGISSYATEDVVFKLHATDNGRYLIEGANGKFADLLVGKNNPNSHQKFIEFYRTYNEAKNQDDCKFQILMHPHRPGHYFIYKKDKGYLTPKGNNPARLKLVTRSQEQEFIMMDAENVQIGTAIDVFNPSNTENQTVFMQAYGFGGNQSNNYLKYDNKYKLVTGNSTSADYFTIYKNNDGTQSILGSNGKYLDIYSSGGFIALFNSTDRYCGDCKFSIEKVSGTQDWYNIRHPKTNKVLSYRDGGGLKFISGNAGWNERFRIVM